MPSETIYHENLFLSIHADSQLSILLGLPTVLYPIGTFEYIADFRRMMQSEPDEVEWSSQHCYSYRYFDEYAGEDKYGLRSMCNSTVILLTKSQWTKVSELIEKAWPKVKHASSG